MQPILFGILTAAAGSGLVFAGGLLLFRQCPPLATRGRWLGALTAGGGFLTGFLVLEGSPLPPREAFQWLGCLAAAAAVLGTAACALAPTATLRKLVAAI